MTACEVSSRTLMTACDVSSSVMITVFCGVLKAFNENFRKATM
jgi:hypothetical protein